MKSTIKNQFVGLHLDFVGFSASMLCAIHCAALPFLLTLAPLAGLQFLENPWIEYSFILLSLVIASNALVHGYRRHHQRSLALMVAFVGFGLIVLGRVLAFEWTEILFTSLGGVAIAVAHLINWRFIQAAAE